MHHIEFLYCIVAAAGSGSRFGGGAPKQFIEVLGRPLLAHTIERLVAGLREAGLADRCQMLVALPPETSLPGACQDIGMAIEGLAGGATRQRSVAKALERAAQLAPPAPRSSWALIHDGDRPCFAIADFIALLEGCQGRDGGFLCYRLNDSLVEIDGTQGADALFCQTRQRDRFRLAATPQLFRLDAIIGSHRRAAEEGWEASDDAALAMRAGHRVIALESSPCNIKLTYPHELAAIESMLARPG